MPDQYGKVTNADYFNCGGHVHRRYDGLMINPFNYEVLPDQWCKLKITNESPDGSLTVKREIVKRERKIIMSQALWCDRGNHAFSSLDEDMEEGTRKIRRRNALGERAIEEVEFHACGQHSQFRIEDEPPSIPARAAADDFRDRL